MKKDFDLVYSDEALLNRALYLASPTKINIFVEDDGKEYRYEEIFERLLSDGVKISCIFPTGGKQKLEEAYGLFGKSKENGKCFFIADGDFDKALKREQVNAPNFVYLKKYNIESYLIQESCIAKFMRPKLRKQINETINIINYKNWESIIAPFFKTIFALHFIVQNEGLGIKNVDRKSPFFITSKGLPNKENLDRYIKEIEVSFPNVEKEISSTIEKLEYIYGTDSTNFVCGKYYIESLARYLSSKLSKGKVGYDELERFLVSNFDIESLAYIRDRLYSYISSN